MISQVVDHSDESQHVDWINELHDPASGLIVVHVPPRCDDRTLAAEILYALGRSPAKRPATSYDEVRGWVAAWLATARPRADLILYGSHRLREDAAAWCDELGHLPSVNVWLVTNRDEFPVASSQPRLWSWSLFASHPFSERDQSRSIALELGGCAAPSDWDPAGLPPFPFSLKAVLSLGPETWRALDRLRLAYRGAREREVRPLLRHGSGPMQRNLAGAVARMTLVSTCRADVSVLCRFLEHDVFMHEGLLHVDIDHVMKVIGGDNPFCQAFEPRRRSVTDGASQGDPEEAGRSVLNLRTSSWQPQYAGEIDVALDGTHFLRSDGVRVEVPPWARWPLRALAWQRVRRADAQTEVDDLLGRRDRVESLYQEVRPLAANVARRVRNGLEPLTTRLADAITCAPQTAKRNNTDTLMPPEAAAAIWTVRRRIAGRNTAPPGYDDPGVQWLGARGFLLEDGSDDLPLLQPWLEGAVSKNTVQHGPFFDYAYHRDWEREATRPNPYRATRAPDTHRVVAQIDPAETVRVSI